MIRLLLVDNEDHLNKTKKLLSTKNRRVVLPPLHSNRDISFFALILKKLYYIVIVKKE